MDLKLLHEKKIINKKYLKLKILGDGELKTKINLTANFASKQAMNKVEKAGGTLNIIAKKKTLSKVKKNAEIPEILKT